MIELKMAQFDSVRKGKEGEKVRRDGERGGGGGRGRKVELAQTKHEI